MTDPDPNDAEAPPTGEPAQVAEQDSGALRVYGAGDLIGDAASEPLEIVEITTHDGPPGRPGREEIVRLIIKLRPRPPRHEQWWWVRRVAGEGRGVIGSTYSPSVDWFDVQFDTPRDLLAQTVKEVRSAVAAADRDYPDQYLAEAMAASAAASRLETDRHRRLDAEQAVIDTALRRQPDEP